jgi:phosphoadenosine phosphosulfate reductase
MTASLTRLQSFYGALDSHALLRVMIHEEFKDRIALVSSFGADSALLIALVAEISPDVPVLFLETDKHFPETLAYVEQLKALFKLTDVRLLRPNPALVNNIDKEGELWKNQPNRCCWLRKVEPLERELAASGFEAIITGRKGYQNKEREGLETIELFDDGIYRINPLAGWNKPGLKDEFIRRNLPQHPLVAEGYLSIGCAPCTTKVKPGEDERSGRWAHTAGLHGSQKTECGIHVQDVPDWNL